MPVQSPLESLRRQDGGRRGGPPTVTAVSSYGQLPVKVTVLFPPEIVTVALAGVKLHPGLPGVTV